MTEEQQPYTAPPPPSMSPHGKISTAIASPGHGQLNVTITWQAVSLKQNADLIRLTLDEARELLEDLRDGIALLAEQNPSNISG